MRRLLIPTIVLVLCGLPHLAAAQGNGQGRPKNPQAASESGAPRQSCAALCASKGHTCAERDTYSTRAMDDGQTYYVGVGNYTPGRVVVLTTCAEVPAAPAAGGTEYWSYMRCVCAQEAGPSWYSQLPQ